MRKKLANNFDNFGAIVFLSNRFLLTQIVPRLFCQLVTIHRQNDGVSFPLVYILLTGKSTQLYRAALRVIKDYCSDVLQRPFNPQQATSDFESGLVPAIMSEFPGVHFIGCYFHFCQALFRRIVDTGLKVRCHHVFFMSFF